MQNEKIQDHRNVVYTLQTKLIVVRKKSRFHKFLAFVVCTSQSIVYRPRLSAARSAETFSNHIAFNWFIMFYSKTQLRAAQKHFKILLAYVLLYFLMNMASRSAETCLASYSTYSKSWKLEFVVCNLRKKTSSQNSAFLQSDSTRFFLGYATSHKICFCSLQTTSRLVKIFDVQETESAVFPEGVVVIGGWIF